MLRLPAVSGRFYPANPEELTQLVRQYSAPDPLTALQRVTACLVPHAGYVYSGHVAGAVFSKILLPQKIIVLGVRHLPRGKPAAILCSGAWRTPLGDVPIDEPLGQSLLKQCPILHEDSLAHLTEHSLEVQLPFLQVLAPNFSFVPIALGTIHFDELVAIGEAIAAILRAHTEILLLTTSDLNHYQDDRTTRAKDKKAIDRLLALDARGLYDVCRNEEISMCGLGPAVAMLTALRSLNATQTNLVRYATSADVSGDTSTVVGYAGLIFA